MKRILHIISIFLLFVAAASSCSFSGTGRDGSSQSGSVNGTYYWDGYQSSHTVTISGNRWSGTSVLYDDVTYEHGSVKGNALYDSSGYIQVGRISGNTIHWGNHTLRRQ